MKQIYLFLIAFAVASTGSAQSLKELFLKMPQEVCPLLSEYNRLELVDNQRTGKPMQTTNQVHNISEMKQLTDCFARLKVTKNSEKVFKLLKTNKNETVIAVVSTVFVDNVPDSFIEFYDLQWHKLDSEGMIDLEQREGFHYMELSDSNDNMRLMTGNPLCLTLDGSNKIAKPKAVTVTMRWTGEKFAQ